MFVCKDAEDARNKGFDYTGADATGQNPAYYPIKLDKVVVVQNGTVQGNPTVDFVLQDETGKKFVFVMTGRLLKMIPC